MDEIDKDKEMENIGKILWGLTGISVLFWLGVIALIIALIVLII